MARISAATIDEVNQRIDIVELVSEYARLERRGGDDWWGCCPFHSEKTPSFHVLPDRKMYHCFGCGAGGGLLRFYMEIEKCTFVEAVKALAKKAGVEIIYDGNVPENFEPKDDSKDLYIELYTRLAGTYRYFLTSTKTGNAARTYLKKRGVSEDIQEKFQLGYSPRDRYWLKRFFIEKNYSHEFLANSGLFSKKNQDVSFFAHRLMFPISNRRGEVVAFGGRLIDGTGPKYLNSGEMKQYKKRKELYAFHLARQAIRKSKKVIICEGYMDVIAYHQAGIEIAVAPLGTALTEEQIKMLGPFVDTIILSFDTDNAGQTATEKAIYACRQQNISVKIIQFEEKTDPAEILHRYGAETLTNYVDCAIFDNDYLLKILSEKYMVNSPEGKTKAMLHFFQYIDVLKSDVQKESCFELLCQKFSLNQKAVRADYLNRDAASKRISRSSTNLQTKNKVPVIKPNAETRAVLAVIANLDSYSLMRNSLIAEDFDDIVAREMFIALEECYRDDALNYENILARCRPEIQQMVASAVTSGEFLTNSQKTIQDSINLVRNNSLLRKRESIMNTIRQSNPITLDEQQKLETLVNEKMNIDFELKSLKDTN
ncbi:MAG TPA: DNA primase [Treponemataceae bacterium]|nr:DNA primase [Treponemataceae bacterium]